MLATIPESLQQLCTDLRRKPLQAPNRVCYGCPETMAADLTNPGHLVAKGTTLYPCRLEGCWKCVCEDAINVELNADYAYKDVSNTRGPVYCSLQCRQINEERYESAWRDIGTPPPEQEFDEQYCDLCNTNHAVSKDSPCIFLLCSVCHEKTCTHRVFYPEMHFPRNNLWFCSLACLMNIEVFLPFWGEQIVSPGREPEALLAGYSDEHISAYVLETARRNIKLLPNALRLRPAIMQTFR